MTEIFTNWEIGEQATALSAGQSALFSKLGPMKRSCPLQQSIHLAMNINVQPIQHCLYKSSQTYVSPPRYREGSSLMIWVVSTFQNHTNEVVMLKTFEVTNASDQILSQMRLVLVWNNLDTGLKCEGCVKMCFITGDGRPEQFQSTGPGNAILLPDLFSGRAEW